MNKKILLVAVPLALAVPVAAFTIGQRQTTAAAAGKNSEKRLTTVTQQSLAQAIDEGTNYLRANPGATFTIRLPAGRFDLADPARPDALASIDVSDVAACPGALVIDGAGMDRTTLVRENDKFAILGRNTRCVTFSDFGFTQLKAETSRGTVVSADAQQVTLDIPEGFPTPDQLMPDRPMNRDGRTKGRRYIRKYAMTPSGPQIVENSPQVRWVTGERASGGPNRWTLNLVTKADGTIFRRGDIIGIKAKAGGQAYRFLDGDRITFDHIRWALDARGAFRKVDHVTITNCVVDRPPPINGVPFLLATSGGGPQIGQPQDRMTTGHLIQGNSFTATGDDSIMMSRGAGAIRDNRITDPFAAGILVVGSPDVVVQGNVLTRAPLIKTDAPERGQRIQRKGREVANDN